MAEHEAAAAVGRLEDLLQIIGNLPSGAGLRRGITGGRVQTVAHEFVARDLPVLPVLLD
jgi:hypothetical protein